VGVVLSQDASDPEPVQLLAEVESIGTRQMVMVAGTIRQMTAAMPIELSFPQSLDPQQSQRIRHLLKHLE
jgi:hypothetical protein